MKTNEIKFTLKDVEVWFYDFKNLPTLLQISGRNILNKKYTVNEFSKIEKDLNSKEGRRLSKKFVKELDKRI